MKYCPGRLRAPVCADLVSGLSAGVRLAGFCGRVPAHDVHSCDDVGYSGYEPSSLYPYRRGIMGGRADRVSLRYVGRTSCAARSSRYLSTHCSKERV